MRVTIGLFLLLSVQACSPVVSTPIENFSSLEVSDNYGRNEIIEQHHNKWRLVNFWATWCKPCREEMPALQKLSQQLSGLDILIVSVDDDRNLVKEFLYKYQITIPSYITTKLLLEQQLSVTQYPTTLLVSPQGRVAEVFIGARDWSSPTIVKQMEQHFDS